jgi:hypothetical protein
LKDRHAKEMELSKQNLVDIYEKKIDYLRERKDESERRVVKLEQDLKDKTKLQVRSKADELQRI